MCRLLIIADDLTGALDSAVAFARRGMRVVAAIAPARLEAAMARDADVVAVNTGSREMPADQAARTIEHICGVVRGYSGIIMKKIDSRLKGPIGAELAALRAAFPRPVLASPAIPRLGRHVAGGRVYGAGIERPIAISPLLQCPAEVPVVRSEADLDAALPGDPENWLLAGAAGLADALARRLAGGTDAPLGGVVAQPSLWAIGSRDPVTLAQLALLRGVNIFPAPNGVVPTVSGLTHPVIQMVEGNEACPADVAGDRFAAGVSRVMEEGDFASLFACGGETAAAVFARLGIGLLDVEGEILPGVPSSRARDGVRGLQVVTKSGGFGPPETLVCLLGHMCKDDNDSRRQLKAGADVQRRVSP